MTATPPVVQVVGGGFQDSEGNALAGGIVYFQLSADATDSATGTLQICSGQRVSYALDDDGNVPNASYLCANNQLVSNVSGNTDTFYWMSAEDENGQLVYGPNAVTIAVTAPPGVAFLLYPDYSGDGIYDVYPGFDPVSALAAWLPIDVQIGGFSLSTTNGVFTITAVTTDTITTNNPSTTPDTHSGAPGLPEATVTFPIPPPPFDISTLVPGNPA